MEGLDAPSGRLWLPAPSPRQGWEPSEAAANAVAAWDRTAGGGPWFARRRPASAHHWGCL